MGSFYQNGIVANLHDFSYGTSSVENYRKLENDLIKFSKVNSTMFIFRNNWRGIAKNYN